MFKKNDMKNIKIISIYVLAILALSGCKYEQRKIISGAKKYLKSEYIPRLHDHKSYELAKIEIVDTVLVSDLVERIERLTNKNMEIENSSKIVKEQQQRKYDDLIETIRAGRPFYQKERDWERMQDQIGRLGNEMTANNIAINLYNKWIKLATDDEIVYIIIYHQFRAKNQMGGVVLDEHEIYYFPQDKSYLLD
jgi:uncharacterized protein YaaR (DUF327 family)